MKILKENPPNLEAIRDAGLRPNSNTIFTYGDVLYNPGGWDIPGHLMKHEETHSERQKEMGVEAWWDKYLKEAKFRLDEEVLAYREQWKYFCERKKNRRKQVEFLVWIAHDLSGELYGNILSFDEAVKLIQGYEDD